MSHLGHPVVRTPALDALAAEGVSFSNHYAQCIPCGPSRASLYTGMYLQNHRSVTNGAPLNARHTNMALECRKLGYDPALIGYTDTTMDPRQYAPNDPFLKTFQRVLPGMTSVLGDTKKAMHSEWFYWLEERGYEVPDDPNDMLAPVANYPGADQRGITYAPPAFSKEESDTAFRTDAALSFVHQRRSDPWFLHVSYIRPHPPYSVAEPYNKLYDPDGVPPFRRASTIEKEASQHPYLKMLIEDQKHSKSLGPDRYPRDEQSMRQLRATYYGMMSEVDHHIGRLISELRQSGQYEDTLIIFGSDHGDQLGDHWLLGKNAYFDESFHVPLIIRAPGAAMEAGRGRVIDEFSENVDLMPTLMELLGLEIPLQCDGKSLVDFLRGGKPERWREEAHWETDFRDTEYGKPEKELGIRIDECCFNVVRGKRYKYVHFPSLPPLFFDLEKDRQELHNVAGEPEYLAEQLRYAQKMISWRMVNDERTLTGMKVGPKGVVERKYTDW